MDYNKYILDSLLSFTISNYIYTSNYLYIYTSNYLYRYTSNYVYIYK